MDGFQIRALLLTMLYRLTPDLITEGKVFIAESPLYEITTKDETYFAYTEAEKEQFIREIGNQKFTVQRSKGLGENEPDMLSLTTMNPKTRRLIQVLPSGCGTYGGAIRFAVGRQSYRTRAHCRKTVCYIWIQPTCFNALLDCGVGRRNAVL